MAKILNKLSHSYFGLQNHGFDPERSHTAAPGNIKPTDPIGNKKSESESVALGSAALSSLAPLAPKRERLSETEQSIFTNKIRYLSEENKKLSDDLKQNKYSLAQLQQQLIQQHQTLRAQEKEIQILNTERQALEHLRLEQDIEQNKHFKIVELLKTQVLQQKKIIQNITEQNQKLSHKVQSLEQQETKLQHQIFNQTEQLQNKESQVTELTQELDQTTQQLKLAQKRQNQILSQVENLLVQEKTFLTEA